MRRTTLRAALAAALAGALLCACASPPIAVPDAARLAADHRAAYRAAARHMVAGEPVAAQRDLERLVALEPWHVPSHVLYQDALRAQGRAREARLFYAAEARAHPDDAARVLLAARIADDAGAGDSGEREGEARPGGEHPRAAPQDVLTPTPRERAYRRALSLDADSPWPALALAYELDREALAAYERSTQLLDGGYAAEADAARTRATDLHDESRTLAERTVTRWPDEADAQAGAAEVLLTRGAAPIERPTLQRALELATRAEELDPGNPARAVLVARVLRALADDPGAARALERALELDPGEPRLLAGLGRVLLDLGRPGDARDVLSRARRRLPDDFDVAMNLGVAEQRSGDLDAAAATFEAAVRLSSGDARAFEALALVAIERGDDMAARRALGAYLLSGGTDRSWAEAALAGLGTPSPRDAATGDR